jgi:hypothetical protein
VRKLRAKLEVTSSNPRNRARVKNRVTCDVRVCEGLPGIFEFFEAGVPPL